MPSAVVLEAELTNPPYGGGFTATNISRYLLMDRPDSVRIRRGRGREYDEVQEGRASFTLDNVDGRFTPELASSPYFPGVKRRRRIKLRHQHWVKNMVLNSDFESSTVGVTPWTAAGSVPPTIARSTTRAFNGSASMLVTWGTGGVLPGVTIDGYGFDIGATYTYSAYVWVPTGSPAVQLVIGGVGFGGSSSLNDQWQRITFTFTATDTQHLFAIWPTSAPTAGQQVWVDAVQVEDGGSASTFDGTDALLTARYFGYVNEWTVETEGKDAVCRVTATDAFKSLAKKTIRPFLVEESFVSLSYQPLAYYPLAETDDATASASDIAMRGAMPLAVTQVNSGGDIQWGQGIGPSTDGQAAPIFAPASATQGYVLRGVVAPSGLRYPFTIELWFLTSTNSRTIATLTGPNDVLELALDSSGALAVNRLSLGGTLMNTNVFATGNLANGALHHISLVMTAGAGPNNFKLQTDGGTAATLPSSQTTAVVGRYTTLTVGGRTVGTESLFNGTIAHVGVFDADAQTSASRYSVGTSSPAERSDLRFNRIALYSGFAFNTTVDTGVSDVEGSEQYQGGPTSLAMLRQVAVTENGLAIVNRDGSLGFQSRSRRYNAAAAFTLDVDLAEQLDHSYDDQLMANTIRVTRPHGADVVVVNAQAKTDHGPDEATIDTLVTSDAEALAAGQWHAQRLGDPPPQLPAIAVEASTLGTTLYRAILAADVSTMFTANTLPAQAPASSMNVFVEGYDELIGPNSHVFVFNTSRANLSTVWQLDSSTYSVLDTSTRLAY